MNSRLFVYVVLALLCNGVFFASEKIKLYAIYTPSHESLKDNYFLPSICDDFDIVLELIEQSCPTAQFMSEGWTQTTIRKVDLIIRAVEENWGKIFIFSDVDIQFFAPIQKKIVKLMQGKDIMLQRNNPSGVLCTGFFACRGNEKTLALWQDVKKTMQEKDSNSDQNSFNKCIRRHNKTNPYGVAWGYLPNIFFGGGTLTGREWRPGVRLLIPNGIVMHHANWTKGIKNKIAQLTYVKRLVKKMRSIFIQERESQF